MKANGRFGFAPAWKARRAEIEVLADRAQAKKHEGRRVEVIQDTIAFRENGDGMREEDDAVEHILKHIVVRKFVHLQTMSYKTSCGLYEYHVPQANSERVVAMISAYAELRLGGVRGFASARDSAQP